MRYFLSLDPFKSANDPRLAGYRVLPALAAGASHTGSVTLGIPLATPPNTYFLLACADGASGVLETNETNNCKPASSGDRHPVRGAGSARAGPAATPPARASTCSLDIASRRRLACGGDVRPILLPAPAPSLAPAPTSNAVSPAGAEQSAGERGRIRHVPAPARARAAGARYVEARF